MIKKLLLLALAAASPATAGQMLRCERPGAEHVTVTLASTRAFGTALNCIDGDFVADLTPCAPTGGFGLSGMSGQLAKVVMRWQDYGDWRGGVVGSNLSDEAIYFDGGFYWGKQEWADQWLFRIDRITGVGTLTLSPNGPAAKKVVRRYTCRPVRPKF